MLEALLFEQMPRRLDLLLIWCQSSRAYAFGTHARCCTDHHNAAGQDRAQVRGCDHVRQGLRALL